MLVIWWGWKFASYDNSTGVITYIGPSAEETDTFTGGTGVTINGDLVSIGQDVGTFVQCYF